VLYCCEDFCVSDAGDFSPSLVSGPATPATSISSTAHWRQSAAFETLLQRSLINAPAAMRHPEPCSPLGVPAHPGLRMSAGGRAYQMSWVVVTNLR
jgi:hypothetical protein